METTKVRTDSGKIKRSFPPPSAKEVMDYADGVAEFAGELVRELGKSESFGREHPELLRLLANLSLDLRGYTSAREHYQSGKWRTHECVPLDLAA